MEFDKYNEDFRESMSKFGLETTPSYIPARNEYTLKFYYRDCIGNPNVLIDLSAAISDNALVIQMPSAFKLGGGLGVYLGIYEYYIGLAKLLGLRKVQIDKSFYRNQTYNEHAEFLSLCLILGLNNNLPGKITIESNPNLELISILKDVLLAQKEISDEEVALSMGKIRFFSAPSINKGELFFFDFLWVGVSGEIRVIVEDGVFYLFYSQNKIQLTGTNGKQELYNILSEVSDNQKLANLLKPPVDNLFKFISNTIDSDKRPLNIYQTIANIIMGEFTELGYEYLDVEREAAI